MRPLTKDFFQTACFLKILSPFGSFLQNFPYQLPKVRKSAIQESFGLALLLCRHMSSNCLLASFSLLIISITAYLAMSPITPFTLWNRVVQTHSKNVRNFLCCAMLCCWVLFCWFLNFLTADSLVRQSSWLPLPQILRTLPVVAQKCDINLLLIQ